MIIKRIGRIKIGKILPRTRMKKSKISSQIR